MGRNEFADRRKMRSPTGRATRVGLHQASGAMYVDDQHAEGIRVLRRVSTSAAGAFVSIPFLMSSPLTSFCRSSVRLFGATYSAAAVLMALDMNPEMKGIFITFGRCSLRGTTLIVI